MAVSRRELDSEVRRLVRGQIEAHLAAWSKLVDLVHLFTDNEDQNDNDVVLDMRLSLALCDVAEQAKLDVVTLHHAARAVQRALRSNPANVVFCLGPKEILRRRYDMMSFTQNITSSSVRKSRGSTSRGRR